MPTRTVEIIQGETKVLLAYNLEEYFSFLKELFLEIYVDGYPVNQIIGLTTGGIWPALAGGRMFGLRPAFLAAQSYEQVQTESTVEVRQSLIFDRELATTQPGIGNIVLCVDDLSDSGKTKEMTIRFLESQFGYAIDQIKFATIWNKTCSQSKPNFFIEPEIGPDEETGIIPYIVQPHEYLFTPEVLKQQVLTEKPIPISGIINRSWEQWTNDIKKLGQLVSTLNINQLIILTMGGLLPGIGVARILKLKPAILAVAHNPQTNIPDHISFARDLIKTTPGLGDRVLIIDDRSWTPQTLDRTVRWLNCKYGFAISKLYTAVLYHGPNGYPVNFAVHKIDPLPNGKMPRLIQPMETEFLPLQ